MYRTNQSKNSGRVTSTVHLFRYCSQIDRTEKFCYFDWIPGRTTLARNYLYKGDGALLLCCLNNQVIISNTSANAYVCLTLTKYCFIRPHASGIVTSFVNLNKLRQFDFGTQRGTCYFIVFLTVD
jgi:hypothetical protein